MAYSWEEENPYHLKYGSYQPPPPPQYAPQASARVEYGDRPPAPPPESNPYIDAAGLGLKAIGTGLNAYGGYKASQLAEDQFDQQKKEYDFEKALSIQDRLREEEERRRRAGLEAGNYAQGYLNNAIQSYGGYNAMRG